MCKFLLSRPSPGVVCCHNMCFGLLCASRAPEVAGGTLSKPFCWRRRFVCETLHICSVMVESAFNSASTKQTVCAILRVYAATETFKPSSRCLRRTTSGYDAGREAEAERPRTRSRAQRHSGQRQHIVACAKTSKTHTPSTDCHCSNNLGFN